jgi:hypothetical protein
VHIKKGKKNEKHPLSQNKHYQLLKTREGGREAIKSKKRFGPRRASLKNSLQHACSAVLSKP